jgi:hypothetical protein
MLPLFDFAHKVSKLSQYQAISVLEIVTSALYI